MGQSHHRCSKPTKKLKVKGTMSNKNFSNLGKTDENFVCPKCLNKNSHKAHHPLCEHSRNFKRKKKDEEDEKMRMTMATHFNKKENPSLHPSLKPSQPPSAKSVANPNAKKIHNSDASTLQSQPSLLPPSSRKVNNPYAKKIGNTDTARMQQMPLSTPQLQPASSRELLLRPKSSPHASMNSTPQLQPASSRELILRPKSLPPIRHSTKVPLGPSVMIKDTNELKALVKNRMDEVRGGGNKVKVRVFEQIDVIIDYLLTLFPSKFESAYKPSSNAPKTKAQDNECRKLFPFNNCAFKVPHDHSLSPPDGDYAIVEGIVVYFLHWEYINPRYCSNISCPYCQCGKLERQQWDWTKYGKVTPVLCIGNELAFAVAMLYKCTNPECKKVVSGNDGKLINKLPTFVTESVIIQ